MSPSTKACHLSFITRTKGWTGYRHKSIYQNDDDPRLMLAPVQDEVRPDKPSSSFNQHGWTFILLKARNNLQLTCIVIGRTTFNNTVPDRVLWIGKIPRIDQELWIVGLSMATEHSEQSDESIDRVLQILEFSKVTL
jgi:hypothetical protein